MSFVLNKDGFAPGPIWVDGLMIAQFNVCHKAGCCAAYEMEEAGHERLGIGAA
jgi:hypothetical protein